MLTCTTQLQILFLRSVPRYILINGTKGPDRPSKKRLFRFSSWENRQRWRRDVSVLELGMARHMAYVIHRRGKDWTVHAGTGSFPGRGRDVSVLELGLARHMAHVIHRRCKVWTVHSRTASFPGRGRAMAPSICTGTSFSW